MTDDDISSLQHDRVVTLRSKRLLLRPLTTNDVGKHYVAWLNDPRVNRYLETRHDAQTLESVRAYVEAQSAAQNSVLFGIILADNERHIGNIKLGPIHDHQQVADVSLFIGDVDCWGRGYATEAISQVVDYAFRNRGLIKLSAGAYVENAGSIAVFQKVGFQLEGLLRRHYMLKGKPSDVVMMGLCQDDLRPALE